MSYIKLDLHPSSPDAELSKYNLDLSQGESDVQNSPCNGKNRTFAIHIANETQWTIDVLLFQLKSSLPARPGYITDTGTFVAASNMGPKKSDIVDPCELKKGAILATWGQYACKAYIDWHGKRYHQDYTRSGSAAAGKYWPELHVKFTEQPAVATHDSPPVLDMVIEDGGEP
ncbi:hypothetical protein [Pseudomonas iridis]|uniref:hypothetical protein n=1 Tax=Pseudomonas iridis TaxID=2710587 RepID=UPI0021C1314C|nr:hypothetical protein [Pseudomonas iridis]MCT8945917.1 hypothetical protein [Pseudomonas iridis]